MPDLIVDTQQLKRIAVELIEIPRVAPKAMASALNRTIQTVQADMKREAVAEYEIKTADVAKSLSVRKAAPSRLTASASSIGRPIALAHFKIKPRKPPARRTGKKLSVKIKKSAGYKVIQTKPSAFVQSVSGATNVFMREGKSRLPIKRLYSLAVPQMIGKTEVLNRIEQKANETLDKRVEHEINYRLSKVKGDSK